MKNEKLLDAFNYVEDQYLAMEENPKKRVLPLKKRAVLLIAAVICVSLLTVTAVAQDWIPSVFQYLKEQNPEDAPLYEAADRANLGKPSEPVELPEMKEASLVVKQKYYDGETILFGLDLQAVAGEPAIGFQPDAELLKEIRVRGNSWSMPPAYEEAQIDGYFLYPRYAGCMAWRLQQKLTPEQFEAVKVQMEQTGHCCVVFQSVNFGDHILVNGVDMMETYDIVDNPYIGITEDRTPVGQAIRLNPLPEAAQNQEQVTVELPISSSYDYWYLEADGHAYEFRKFRQRQTATFTIDNSKAEGGGVS